MMGFANRIMVHFLTEKLLLSVIFKRWRVH